MQNKLEVKVVHTKDAKMKRNHNGSQKDNLQMLLMCLPTLLYIFIFCYIPIFGVILAFKSYDYKAGILGSRWIGFSNFKFFFTSQDAWRITRNTVCLNALFIIGGTIFAVLLALILYEVTKTLYVKIYQTILILPSYLSWVVVGYMAYAFLNPNMGIMNQILKSMHMGEVMWYSNPGYWPGILVFAVIWKNIGVNCVIYYAGLMGVNKELYEAAKMDGANKWQCIKNISIPALVPLITIMTILAIGGIFRSDFGMFFNLTRDIGYLYPTTDVIDTYVYRALRQLGDIGMSSAVGLYQSVVGFVLILVTNKVVKRIEPDNALF